MRKKIYALVDCNNFYVSCERVFHASLRARPVIVLSNNDGCVVARSNEVKKLGIKMGQPIFECEELIRKHNIQIFSSNYSLYADMSARVMKVLSQFSPRLEVYSIDEAFLDLSEQIIDDLSEFGRTIKARVLQFTGIPVSIGIASTKCLTKVANEIVKKDARYAGVLDVTALSEQATDEMLAKVAIEDVWGIGSKYSLFLMNHGILSAKDLKYADEKRAFPLKRNGLLRRALCVPNPLAGMSHAWKSLKRSSRHTRPGPLKNYGARTLSHPVSRYLSAQTP